METIIFCAFPGCDNPKSQKAALGLCNSHYWQHHKGRELTPLSYRRNRCVPWIEEHTTYDGDDCLIWPFQRAQESGVAMVKFKGKQGPATRVMCEMAHGKPPTPQHEAAHSCGKGHLGCISPKHLRWATHTENLADQLQHGTRIRGEKQHFAFLTENIVMEIRALAGSMPQAAIARRFCLRPQHVGKIINRKLWRHV